MPECDDNPIADLLRGRTENAGDVTLDEIVRLRAAQHGERTVYKFLAEGEAVTDEVTYAEFDRRARAIGGWLQQNGYAGEPVLLIFPEGIDYVAAFFGCLYAGAIAVPINPPRRNRKSARLETVAADCSARCVLTVGEALDRATEAIKESPLLGGLTWQPVEAIDPHTASAWQPAGSTDPSPALLQYTSGSTGTPKGVIVSHGNLVENQELITRAFGQDESVVLCGWLPIYHDMGLIGNVMHPIYRGGQHVFMPPMAFLQKPLRWLQMIDNHGGTLAGGPDFAFDLCVRETTPDERAKLDLSSWQVAFNGSEPLRAKTMERFQEAFAIAGLGSLAPSPCFGMAETTLLVSGSRKTKPALLVDVDRQALKEGRVEPANGDADAQRLVGCGPPDNAVRLEIVDPLAHTIQPAGQVGEVWISGKTVAQGYWNKPQLTQEIFQATIAGEPNVHFLRTGDLGVVHGGELFITGRRKDLIIVRGANHYPQDIEATASAAHESLLPGSAAAFSSTNDQDDTVEQVVLVQEVQRSWLRKLPTEEVLQAVQRAVIDEHQVSLARVVLIRTGQLPKTTSGKIQRSLTRDRLLAGELKVVGDSLDSSSLSSAEAAKRSATDNARSGDHLSDRGRAPSPSLSPLGGEEFSAADAAEVGRVRDWLVAQIAERTGLPSSQIDPGEPFARYGYDSLAAVRLSGKLSEWLGREVQPTIAYNYPTPEAVARYLVLGDDQPTVHSLYRNADEPLAVIGMGCRFPGGENLHAFWQLLANKQSAIVDEPTDRWPANHRPTDRPRRGGYLPAIDQFDPAFFGISPREAEQMDPQQRLLLEVAWETLENAGLSPQRYRGQSVGAFVGVSSGDYSRSQAESGVPASAYSATGGSLAVLANRLSYTLDLRGPSLAIDTACSSSLVAVHQAAESVRRGDCDLALAGGVSLIVSEQPTQSLHDAGMLSPRGECSSFTRGADGFVRGEGCGLVLLKPLSKAIADGDRIYSVLRGTAVNQDGRSNGLTAPNGPSQRAVIRRALASCNLQPGDIDYLEAHGTGTELGDPTEMDSLIAVFAKDRQEPLQIGSVKANIGHLEGAAGIAGLIKTCLSLQHGQLLPQPDFDPASSGPSGPSEHIDWSQPIHVPHELADWSDSQNRIRRAGVSSFGFGGTNAHAVVEAAPALPKARINHEVLKGHEVSVWTTLSAKTQAALVELAELYANEIVEKPLEAIAYAANVGQASHSFRLAVGAGSTLQLKQRLASWAESGSTGESILYAEISPGAATPTEDLANDLAAAARQWIGGAKVDFKAFHPRQRLSVTLPSYPWQRQRYWFGEPKSQQLLAQGERVHPLLGVKLDLAGEQVTFETDLTAHPWLQDHRLRDQPTLPAVAYIEMAIAAASTVDADANWQVVDLDLKRPIGWQEAAELCRVQTTITPSKAEAANSYEVTVQQRTDEGWQLAALCSVQRDAVKRELPTIDTAQLTDRDVLQHYQRCEVAGLGYGAAFQGIGQLAGKVGTARSVIALPEGVSSAGYALHPAVADTALQTLSAALPEAWQDAWVPQSFRRATVAKNQSDSGPLIATATIETSLAGEPPTELVADVQVATEAGQRVAQYEGVTLSRVALSETNRFFQVAWEPQLRERETSKPPQLRAARIASSVAEQAASIAAETGAAGHLSRLEQLERESAEYVVQAIAELDGDGFLHPGAKFTSNDARLAFGVAAEKQRLLHRLLQILQELGYLRQYVDTWQVIESITAYQAETTSNRTTGFSPEQRLLQRCGKLLPGVLRGEVDPLPILFPSEETAGGGAADVYRHAPGAVALNRLAAEAVAEAIAQLPAGRGLRVLELGAGTGATTERVLARNDVERMRYTFTDVAAGFVAAEQQRLPQHENLSFETLDIERDPIEQGFEAGAYDVIIAANVLHATADIAKTLDNTRKLLAAGGQLLLVEGTRPVRWLDLTFGLTDGWWRFTDTDLRADYALLSVDDWRGVLGRSGFAETESVEVVPPADGTAAENSLLIATAGEEETGQWQSAEQATGRTTVIAWNDSDLAAIESALRSSNCEVDPLLLDDFTAETQLSPALIVVAPVGAKLADSLGAEQLTSALLGLLQRVQVSASAQQTVSLVTRAAEPSHAALVGFTRAAARELQEVELRVIEVSSGELQPLAPAIVDEILSESGEPEVQLRPDGRFVRRLVDASSAYDPLRSRELVIRERGTLSGAVLQSVPRQAPQPGEVQIRIAAAGLNFRDLLNVLDKYPGAPPLGAECSGTVEAVGAGVTELAVGERVVAVTGRTFADFVNVPADAVLRIDRSISLEEAATLPVAYGTASVALEELGQVTNGTKVLIHAATGGVGTAALEIAAERDCEVFATASHSKQWLLRRSGIKNVYDSRSDAFASGVLQDSAGEGVQVLVNALPEEFVEANLRALADGGIYVDLTKPAVDVAATVQKLRPDVRYELVDLAAEWEARPQRIRDLVQPILDRVASGKLQPLRATSFALDQMDAAFRQMQSPAHVGKILLHPNLHAETARAPIRDDGAYVIAGGFGDLGLLTAEWLADQGAGCIALLGRSRPAAEVTRRIDTLAASGVRVLTLQADIADFDQLSAAFAEIRRAGLPVRGVIHAAGTLDDGTLANQSAEKIARVFAAKVRGAWNLHNATKEDPLELFTVYSSIASVLGAPGQANHSAANAYLDGLMHWRLASDLPARSINWGPWRDLGEAARRGVDARQDLAGIEMLSPQQGKQAIAELVGTSGPAVTVAPWNLTALPERLRQTPLLARLLESGNKTARQDDGKLRQVLAAAPPFQHEQILSDYLREQLAAVLGIGDPADVSPTTAMFDLGLDSLTTLELKNALAHSTALELPANLMFDFPTIEALSAELARRLADGSQNQTSARETSVSEDSPNASVEPNAQSREPDAPLEVTTSAAEQPADPIQAVASEPSVWDDLASLEQELEAWEGSRS